MTNEKFKEMLAQAGFKNKKEFAETIGLTPKTVRLWAYDSYKQGFPAWLEPALNYAIRAKNYDDLMSIDPEILDKLEAENFVLRREFKKLTGYFPEDKDKAEKEELRKELNRQRKRANAANARIRHIKRLNRGY